MPFQFERASSRRQHVASTSPSTNNANDIWPPFVKGSAQTAVISVKKREDLATMGIQGRIDVPSQVIDDIFKQREGRSHKYIFRPNLRLYPLLLVCKEWHDLAERRLYASVSLGSKKMVLDEDGDEMEVEGEQTCELFYETVSSNPRLASLVRELRLATKNHSKEETKKHVALLNLCENVERVEIAGYNGSLLDELKDALAQKAKLTSLTVSRYGLRDMEGDEFCHVSDLFSYMLKWPHLQKVYAENSTLRSYCDCKDNTLPDVEDVVLCCPALTEFTVRESCLRTVHLERLEKMAPSVQKLEICVSSDVTETLARCLNTWSSTLAHLHLSVNGDEPCSLASVSSDLTELQYLNVASSVIPPSAFAHFNKLEAVMYFASAKHAKELASIVRKKGTLPALKKLTCDNVSEDDSEDEDYDSKDDSFFDAIEDLRAACEARKLEFSDSLLEEEEAREELGRYDDDSDIEDDDSDFEEDDSDFDDDDIGLDDDGSDIEDEVDFDEDEDEDYSDDETLD